MVKSVKSLFNLCLSALCETELSSELAFLPGECKQKLLEFFASHDQLSAVDCNSLLTQVEFGSNLTQLSFFLTDELTDEQLISLTANNKRIGRISLVECSRVTDAGILAATRDQHRLCKLELRAMYQLSDDALTNVSSPVLHSVDLSGCSKITNAGLHRLLSRHPNIKCLYLNHCRSLDDLALYSIAQLLGERLQTLEMDFPSPMKDPEESLRYLSSLCPNLSQLSIARFFNTESQPASPSIDGHNLRDVDLYANFFPTLPQLPDGVTTLRLSVSGEEDAEQLVESLSCKSYLRSINLQVTVRDGSIQAIDNANALLCRILAGVGEKVTILQVSIPRVFDEALSLLMRNTPNLTHLALEVNHLSTHLLQRYFSGGLRSKASGLRSLRICRLRITYRVLFAIARGARNLEELETSHMRSVDDRFVSLLADNCRNLQTVNFNGCRWLSDIGMGHLARRCPLREVRMRGTACTDKSVYTLAQFCPELEWISYADYSGNPKFTETALQCLRDSCISRVIC